MSAHHALSPNGRLCMEEIPGVCEDLLWRLIPGYCWHRCPDQLEEVPPSLSKGL